MTSDQFSISIPPLTTGERDGGIANAERSIDLIHIGYHKCGSSTLQRRLFDNRSEIAFTREARLALGSMAEWSAARWNRPDFDAARCHVISSEGLCGIDYQAFERSPASDEFPKSIHNTHPETTILIVVRRQADILKSYYTESLIKFANTNKIDDFIDRAAENRILCYYSLVKKYVDLFGTNSVCVLPFELFLTDPMNIKTRISKLIGVDCRDADLSPENVGGKRLSNEMIRRLNYAFRLLGDQRPLTSRKRQLRQHLDKLTPKHLDRPYITSAAADVIQAHYRQSNKKLSQLCGIDFLGAFGY